MDHIPGLTELIAKILSECGIVSGVFFFLTCAFAWQLAKTRAAWENDRQNTEKLRGEDRKNVMQIISDSNKAYDNLANANSELRGILLTLQIREQK